SCRHSGATGTRASPEYSPCELSQRSCLRDELESLDDRDAVWPQSVSRVFASFPGRRLIPAQRQAAEDFDRETANDRPDPRPISRACDGSKHKRNRGASDDGYRSTPAAPPSVLEHGVVARFRTRQALPGSALRESMAPWAAPAGFPARDALPYPPPELRV